MKETDTTKKEDIGKRIEKILDVLQKAAGGDMNVSAPVSENTDELDALAAGINMMIEEVRERTKELEQKNEDLERFNRIAVGRELKMVELKKRIQDMEGLLKKNGIKP